ncbi:MAG: helix-turn-helix domain-containing protein, partial [Actinomycetota bacterium]
MTSAHAGTPAVGELIRDWRLRRRLSQLDLSIQADISTRHLSFVETGRSRPTPQMILRLTEQLDVPLRERNTMLLAGGYAPAYPQHGLDEPELESVRAALRQVLAAHQPNPAILINRWWELVDLNPAV